MAAKPEQVQAEGETVQFRLLGVVDAVSAGHPVNLGHARQRSVLAVLLIEANRFVSVDQLMDRVWDDQPPQRGPNALYSYLSRLRTTFASEPSVTIERRRAGYRLILDEATVDLHQFRNLIKQARSVDEANHALALFDQALHLWRGTPFADLDTPWLVPMRTALDLERQAAELDRTDAALRCEHHATLLADLTTRAAQHPVDERIAGQLMIALAGAGRQADALTTYHHTRQLLLDELGLEPGPDLRRLHKRILTGDTSSTVPTPTNHEPRLPAAQPDTVIPHQLPAATGHFTGRQAELDKLIGPMDSTNATGGTIGISAIDGMAGIGKTALAVHAAHQLADHFPDGVLFADLHGFTPEADPTPPEQVLDQLLHGLGVPGPRIPPDLESRVGLYRSVLARRRVLVVLDNAADETQLRPLLPATPGCRVIVTSRRHLLALDDAAHLTLPVLDPAEAAGLFLGLARNQATPADQHTIDRIVALCGRLPLAIRIAAARLPLAPAGGPAALCAELADALDAGSGLEWLSDGHRAIGAALAVSYRHLTDDQRQLFQLTGLHPGPHVEPYAVAALADTTVADAQRLLEDLYAASLINQPSYHHYALHDLVAAYASRLADTMPESDRRTALSRLYDHYAATSSRAMDLTRPWETDHRPRPPATRTPTPTLSDQHQAQAWLDTETDNLLATAHHAVTQHRPEHTLHQSATLHRHLLICGHFGRAALLYEQALTIARQTGNRSAELHALNSLGCVHRVQGRYQPAADCFQLALAGARQTGNHSAEQDAQRGLGLIHYLRGQHGQAADCFEQAVVSVAQTGNRGAEQDALVNLGYVHLVQGRYGSAVDCYERALAGARQVGNYPSGQEALIGLGGVHILRGRYEQASDCFEQALAGARQTGNHLTEQDALRGLGAIHRLNNRYERASDCFEQALARARQIGDYSGEQVALNGLGNVRFVQAQYGPAADCFEQALTIARQVADRNGQFEANQGLGRVHHATNNHHDAFHHHQTALRLAVDLDQPSDQARAHDGLAHTHRALGDPDQANHHWHAALHLLTSIGTDHTEEPSVATATIRTHLHDIDHPSTTRRAHDTPR